MTSDSFPAVGAWRRHVQARKAFANIKVVDHAQGEPVPEWLLLCARPWQEMDLARGQSRGTRLATRVGIVDRLRVA